MTEENTNEDTTEETVDMLEDAIRTIREDVEADAPKVVGCAVVILRANGGVAHGHRVGSDVELHALRSALDIARGRMIDDGQRYAEGVRHVVAAELAGVLRTVLMGEQAAEPVEPAEPSDTDTDEGGAS